MDTKCKNCSERAIAKDLCKKCYFKEWAQENRDKILRNKKRYYEKHKVRIINKIRNYQSNNIEKVKDWRKKRQKRYKNNNPDKIVAHAKSQKIKPKKFCENCSTTEKLEKHHPNYSEPMFVITLCVPCHNKIHGRNLLSH